MRPQTVTLTVNIADALHFLTSKSNTLQQHQLSRVTRADGYLKSSIHRVVAPPKDQVHIDRLGVLYMVRLEDDTDLVPIQDSPVLRELGLLDNKLIDGDGKTVKAGEWVKQRIIKKVGTTSTERGDSEETDVEVVKGVKVKYYD